MIEGKSFLWVNLSIIQSLNKILTYDFEDVFCSHAGYLKNGRNALKRKLAFLLDMQGSILRLHDEGIDS